MSLQKLIETMREEAKCYGNADDVRMLCRAAEKAYSCIDDIANGRTYTDNSKGKVPKIRCQYVKRELNQICKE